MNRVLIVFLFAIFCSGSLIGCSAHNFDSAERIKLPANEATKIDLTVSKADLRLALGDEYKTSKLRAVEVFQNSTSTIHTSRVFRLFDLEPGSVYELLGLKEADVVVAVNERVIVAPQVIGQVVRLLPKEKSVKFEILRAGKSYIVSTKFI